MGVLWWVVLNLSLIKRGTPKKTANAMKEPRAFVEPALSACIAHSHQQMSVDTDLESTTQKLKPHINTRHQSLSTFISPSSFRLNVNARA